MWLAEPKIPSWGMICPKKVRPKIIRPNDVIGRADDSVLRFVRRMLRSLLIGWADASVLYDEASALSSCQTNLIGRAAQLLFLVNATWLVCPIDCPVKDASDWLLSRSGSRVFYWLLSHAMSDMQTRWQRKRLRESFVFAVTNTRQYAVLTCLWRLNR